MSEFGFKRSTFVFTKRSLQAILELLRPSLRRQTVEELDELVEVDGLGDVLVAAGGERLGVEVGRVMRGDGDDGYAARLLLSADAPRGGQSVELRQAQIHQDDVWLIAGGTLDGLVTVDGLDHLIAAHLQ